MDLIKISKEFIPRALKKAEKYRMLNHPKTSESICLDILDVEPQNQDAIVQLIIAITGQFSNHLRYPGAKLKNAQELLGRLNDDYLKKYFAGLILERWATARIRDLPGTDLYEFLIEAMEHYSQAIKVAPEDDESAVLHYNFCIRFIDRHPHIKPPEIHADADKAHRYGDGFVHH